VDPNPRGNWAHPQVDWNPQKLLRSVSGTGLIQLTQNAQTVELVPEELAPWRLPARPLRLAVRAGEQALGQTANTLASMGRREDRYRYLCLTPCSAYDRIIQILCLYRLAIGLVPTRS
jgi:hypothetical protein